MFSTDSLHVQSPLRCINSNWNNFLRWLNCCHRSELSCSRLTRASTLSSHFRCPPVWFRSISSPNICVLCQLKTQPLCLFRVKFGHSLVSPLPTFDKTHFRLSVLYSFFALADAWLFLRACQFAIQFTSGPIFLLAGFALASAQTFREYFVVQVPNFSSPARKSSRVPNCVTGISLPWWIQFSLRSTFDSVIANDSFSSRSHPRAILFFLSLYLYSLLHLCRQEANFSLRSLPKGLSKNPPFVTESVQIRDWKTEFTLLTVGRSYWFDFG